MTVKCLSQDQKEHVIHLYCHGEFPVSTIAGYYGVSHRTINRVLNEFEVPTPQERAEGDLYHLRNLMRKHNMTPNDVEELIVDHVNRNKSHVQKIAALFRAPKS